MRLPQFGLRALLMLTFVCACCVSATSYIVAARKSAHQKLGLGIQHDPAYWPVDLRNLVKNNETLKDGLIPCGLTAGFDHSSIWRLESNAPMIYYLKHQAGLRPTTHLHPKVSQLISSMPIGWPIQNWRSSVYYATPRFGTEHIEGADLYLIAIDSINGEALVLHENHF